MTEVQNFMLVVCFGCTIGFLIGTFSIMPGSVMNPNFISSVFIMAGVLRIKEGIKNPFI
jgi:hypothetical protein